MVPRLKWWLWPLLVAPVIGALAVASYVTSQLFWDGGYPAGQIRILVVDDSGNPVPGVSLHVSEPVPGQWGGIFLLQENGTDSPMVSGADGVITCHSRGLKFGGEGWDLFWLFPMDDRDGPQFNFEFTKSGYRSSILNADEFFHFTGRIHDAAPTVTTRLAGQGDGTLPVWTQKVVLHGMSKS